MTNYQIEYWALQVVERVKLGHRVEDSLVELKSNWIPPDKAARRIAGHSNAARGEPILWLIGVDEDDGLIGVNDGELADWYGAVKAQFDGILPQMYSRSISVDGKTVMALFFETDRAPFVVKNPAYGKTGGGPVELEVPWREGISTRSATRSDLVMILSPMQSLPKFEILRGSLGARQERAGNDNILIWELRFDLYVEASLEERVVIPFHRCEASFEIPGILERTNFGTISLHPPRTDGSYKERKTLSLTIDATQDEIIISGPGKVFLVCSKTTPPRTGNFRVDATANIRLLPIDAQRGSRTIFS